MIVAFGAAKAKKNGLKNLEFRLGDLQNPPIQPGSVDLAILSQALHHAEDPAKALAGAFRVLRPGGSVMVLDLLKHNFKQARELYGDRWQGFDDETLSSWLTDAGLVTPRVQVGARGAGDPFVVLVACATRPDTLSLAPPRAARRPRARAAVQDLP